MSPRSVEEEIHALEEQRDRALLLADSDTLARLLDDGLVYTYWSGRSDGKTNYLEGVKSGRFVYRKLSGQMNAYSRMTALPWSRDAPTWTWL